MQRVSAVLGSALFFVVAPCVLAGLIPWSMTRWEFRPAFFGLEGARSVGVLLILVGLPGLVDSFARFALQGLGTPAPLRHPRTCGDRSLSPCAQSHLRRRRRSHPWPGYAVWRLAPHDLGALFMWLAFHLFVVAYEEPTLRCTFGSEYEAYRANVRRWVPRVVPWRAPEFWLATARKEMRSLRVNSLQVAVWSLLDSS